MDKQYIQKAQRHELELRITELCGDMDDIDIQLSRDAGDDRDGEWRSNARFARNCKMNEVRLCRNRIKVISREELKKSERNLSNAERVELAKSLDRAIIKEIRILVDPSEFLECIDRAKLKVDYDERLQKLRDAAK